MGFKIIKICFIQLWSYPIAFNYPNQLLGGSEVQLSLIAKKLAENKSFEVSFIVGDFGQKKIEKKANILFYKLCGLKKESGFFGKISKAIKYFNLMKKIDADVYFTSAAGPDIGVISIFCKILGKKHVHRVASNIDVDETYIKRSGLSGLLYGYGLKNSNAIMVQSKDQQYTLLKYHAIKSTIVKNSFKIYRRRIKHKKIILWVGKARRLKKPELFIDLSKEFPKENFVMICPIANEELNYFSQVKSKAGEVENLQFIKLVQFSKIQKWFNEAKVFVNTSEYEGFPNTFLQAGLGKTPILSLNVNPDNFLVAHNCGYSCNDNFIELKEKLHRLLVNKRESVDKGKNSFDYVKKNHDINKNILKIKKMIRDVIN